MEKTLDEAFRRIERLERMMMVLGITEPEKVMGKWNMLPPELTCDEARLDVLNRAMRSGLLCLKDGHLDWRNKSKTLLAYFCGRVWCGDSLKYDTVDDVYLWHLGEGHFPEACLNALFGVKGLRLLRNQRNYKPVPTGHEVVDSFFRKHD